LNNTFRTKFSQDIFNNKYLHELANTWQELSKTLVNDVCSKFLDSETVKAIEKLHAEMKFIAGGRYLYYAGRKNKFFNNCYLLKSEYDSREDWANLSWKAESCLMTGGGIGNDYSVYRGEGQPINKTGGYASGPISKMVMINEIGRNVMQGGSRRSAIYGSLNWQHQDISKFLNAKDWHKMYIPGTNITYKDAKEKDFSFPAPLDMTNISANYDDDFIKILHGKNAESIYFNKTKNVDINPKSLPTTFIDNCRKALQTGEPGFSFNFLDKAKETLRNACCEVTSEDDSDVCNLGSLNMANYETIEEWKEGVRLGTMFLLCGTLVADLPYKKVYETREKNRRLGLGLMGVHEWLLKRGYKYEVVDELKEWLEVYRDESRLVADKLSDELSISRPVACRSVAPTGTIAIMGGTTTGIEPLYAVSYKRRFLVGQSDWHYQYVIDGTAKYMIQNYGVNPDSIETSIDLAKDWERRIKFQADVQDYVDMAISGTINIPEWGSELNNENRVLDFATTLAKYSHRLRGFTVYPDGSRGGQPLESVPYSLAVNREGIEYEERYHDICDITKGGFCGV
jgi:ribonucleoside-diphosphate reductase alpha chain